MGNILLRNADGGNSGRSIYKFKFQNFGLDNVVT